MVRDRISGSPLYVVLTIAVAANRWVSAEPDSPKLVSSVPNLSLRFPEYTACREVHLTHGISEDLTTQIGLKIIRRIGAIVGETRGVAGGQRDTKQHH